MQQIIHIASLEELPYAAQRVLEWIGNHHIVAFYGAMGAGKTTLIKALCTALSVEDQVSSPTFTLINEYRTSSGRMVYHFDFYRIKKIEEAYDLGCGEYFDGPGLCLIEWPELIEPLLPEDALRITISECRDGAREIRWGVQ